MLYLDYYNNLHPELKEYFKIVSAHFPEFLIPYIETKTMQRIRNISHFCGMHMASKAIYNFKYYKSRLDHSIGTALITWQFTKDKKQTIAALYHDAGSPVFCHVIDYLNNDLVHQESTEIDLIEILKKDKELLSLLEKENIKVEDIANYKNYPIVDNKRPKLCADRLDGIFLSNLIWAQGTTIKEIEELYNNINLELNEDGILEFSFKDYKYAKRLIELNQEIDDLTHSDEDYYFMNLLASIVRRLLDLKIIKYQDLYELTDIDLFNKIEKQLKNDAELAHKYDEFKHLKTVPKQKKPEIKNRIINPLVNGIRYYNH